ncbi:MAG: phage major capsid protein [Terrimicrobiaceae bacterium]
MSLEQMRQQRAALIAKAKALVTGAQTEKRGFTPEERTQHDALMAQVDALKGDIARLETLEREERDLAAAAAPANRPAPTGAPAFNRTGLGDSEGRAFFHYLRTGDRSRELAAGDLGEQRASNATDLNITTAADGGVTVPTSVYGSIIAKRDEDMLSRALGVLNIPGIGTTVDVPYDNGTANEFVSTAEASAFDLDGPALAKASMTLVLYSKKIQISYQLLQDQDAQLQAFLDNYVGRAMARTHNSLLSTAVLAGGTTNALGSASAATATDIPKLVYALKAPYADKATWMMKRATQGAYRALAGSVFQFAATPAGGDQSLWNYPLVNNEYVPAIGTGNKSLVFGNFQYVGMRESPSITMLRDPYSAAGSGQVNIYYYFRTVYKVLEAEAIQYGTHP